MAALTANTNRKANTTGTFTYDVAAAKRIYKGGAVGMLPTGYVQPFLPGDDFVGIAFSEADNTDGTAGDTTVVNSTTGLKTKNGRCVVAVEGEFQLPLTGVAVSDIGKAVYATSSGDFALTGHYDGFVGRCTGKAAANTAWVRLKQPGELPSRVSDTGSLIISSDFDFHFAAIVAAGTAYNGGFKMSCVGAVFASGSLNPALVANGAATMLLGTTSEAENLTIETPPIFDITKAIKLKTRLTLQAAGGAATDDLDFGLITAASNTITDGIRADMAVTTAGIKRCLYHVDANGLDLEVQSDNDTSDLGEQDTTLDIVVGTYNDYVMIARVGGACELYVDGVAKTVTNTPQVSATGVFAGVVNIEKSTGAGAPNVRVDSLRITGGRA